MELSDYTGQTPQAEPKLVVGHVAQHHRWTTDAEGTANCPYCDAALALHERHLLVTLSEESESLLAGRRCLCDESCLQGRLNVE